MRCCAPICAVLILCGSALPQGRRSVPPLPDHFAVGRHTFFDFGPPNDFYELLLARPRPNGTSVERITLTPAGDACTQQAKVEADSASLNESVAALLGNTNPCTIPEKELRRELKRCKKCLVFSGANIAMQVQCGTPTRIVRSDILDKDMFDPASHTPEHTSWTMQLLGRLDKALGPGVMDKPVFPVSEREEPPASGSDSETLQDVRSGKVVFKVAIDPNGGTTTFTLVSGHPLLREAVKQAVSVWKFPKEDAERQIEATIEFATNCPGKTP